MPFIGHGHDYQVGLLAGGAQILPIHGGILHTLHNPDLARGPVVVVYGDWGPIPGLLVGADLALGVTGAGSGGHRGVLQHVLGVHTGHSIRNKNAWHSIKAESHLTDWVITGYLTF